MRRRASRPNAKAREARAAKPRFRSWPIATRAARRGGAGRAPPPRPAGGRRAQRRQGGQPRPSMAGRASPAPALPRAPGPGSPSRRWRPSAARRSGWPGRAECRRRGRPPCIARWRFRWRSRRTPHAREAGRGGRG
eukprot:scaffold7583_cov118-Isochrysis_galbana.AAC.10